MLYDASISNLGRWISTVANVAFLNPLKRSVGEIWDSNRSNDSESCNRLTEIF